MKKTLFILGLFLSFLVRANDGMWIPSLLMAVEDDMHAMGLKLTSEEIYSVNHSSLKDAVVHFGGGCTAEVVSKDGLLFTNHHCGYSQIQQHSSLEHNYLEDGFWAMTMQDELSNDNLTATFIISISDVTDKILDGITDNMDETKRMALVEANSAVIRAEVTKDNSFDGVVKAFNYGNQYYLILTKTYRDVRLVAAPPSSIGKFGFDTDNWMWPRHTGDFSVFRIYANKDNEPAEFAMDNVPYHPAYHFSVSIQDKHKGDFTMVYGFPGSTEQFLTSDGVNYIQNIINPARIKMRDASLAILEAEMESSPEIKLMYATKQSSISNSWKKWIGENNGLKKLHVIDVKKELEAEFMTKLAMNPSINDKYSTIIESIAKNYKDAEIYDLAYYNFIELIYYGPAIFRFGNAYFDIEENYNNWDATEKNERIENLKNKCVAHFKTINSAVDQKLFVSLFSLYLQNVDPSLLPDVKSEIDKKYKGSVVNYARYLYNNSVFCNENLLQGMLNNFTKSSLKKIAKDPVYQMVHSVYDAYNQKVKSKMSLYYYNNQELMRTYVKVLQEVVPERVTWADANSTLRLAYGKIDGSYPRDGMKYIYYSTLEGVMEKYIPNDREYDAPEKLILLYKNKDYGPYAQDGMMRICFTATNHTTGGNSGSPVLDGNGNLIGINFDRSWESTMSDIMYNPATCRNISVDIRYVLFLIDKFGEDHRLIEEMDIVDDDSQLRARAESLKQQVVQLTDSIRVNANDANLFNLRGKAYAELKQYPEALNDYDVALKLKANDYNSLFNKGELLNKMKRNIEALKTFNLLIKYYPKNAKSFFARGLTYTDLGKYRDAVYDFSKAISLDQTYEKAYYNRGVCYQLLGRQAEGCDDLKMAKSLGGVHEDFLYRIVCE